MEDKFTYGDIEQMNKWIDEMDIFAPKITVKRKKKPSAIFGSDLEIDGKVIKAGFYLNGKRVTQEEFMNGKKND